MGLCEFVETNCTLCIYNYGERSINKNLWVWASAQARQTVANRRPAFSAMDFEKRTTRRRRGRAGRVGIWRRCWRIWRGRRAVVAVVVADDRLIGAVVAVAAVEEPNRRRC